MNATNWLKGVVVAVGVSLSGGAALAASPTPMGAPSALADRFDRDHDGGGWHNGDNNHGRNDNDDWDGYRGGRFDGTNFRLFRLGRQKVSEGRALQAQAEQLTRQARWSSNPRLFAKARRMDDRGERLEREGLKLIRRARG